LSVRRMHTRSYLKKVFSPNLCVRPSFQVLDILEYACRRSRDVFGALETRSCIDLKLKSYF
ncbi:MAG: hypothetical protein PVJ06_02140, partial [Desulfobacterales bacterium]